MNRAVFGVCLLGLLAGCVSTTTETVVNGTVYTVPKIQGDIPLAAYEEALLRQDPVMQYRYLYQWVEQGEYAAFFRATIHPGDLNQIEKMIQDAGGDKKFNKTYPEENPTGSQKMRRISDVVKTVPPQFYKENGRSVAYFEISPPIEGIWEELNVHGYRFYLVGDQWKATRDSQVYLTDKLELLLADRIAE